jgi:hypothetical protein
MDSPKAFTRSKVTEANALADSARAYRGLLSADAKRL